MKIISHVKYSIEQKSDILFDIQYLNLPSKV